MNRRLGAWLLAGICVAAAAGCSGLSEPPDSNLLITYRGMARGDFFTKSAVEPGADLRGFTRARVRAIRPTPEVESAWHSAGGTKDDLVRIVTQIRFSLHRELATRFEVLHDDSLVDGKTVVISVYITQMTPVSRHPGLSDAAPGGVDACAEMQAWKGTDPYPFARIKDWRSGRQSLRSGRETGAGRYGQMVSIFRLWGENLRGLLLALGGSRPAERF